MPVRVSCRRYLQRRRRRWQCTCVAQGDGVNSIATFDGQSIDRTTTVAQGDGVVAQVTTDQCLGISNVAIGDDVVATTTEHGR